MTEAMDWLNARAPGFGNLSAEEQNAIGDFALLWGLFESRILNNRGSANAIYEAVQTWQENDALAPDLFDEQLAYFKQRHPNHEFTHHFAGLL